MPTTSPFPSPLLAIGADAQSAAALCTVLLEAGADQVQAGTCFTLVQQAAAVAPQQVICVLPGADPALLEALAAWGGEPPCAVIVVAPGIDAAAAVALVRAGVSVWVPQLPTNGHLSALLAVAHARYQHDAAQRGELARAREQLDERKWVDRAKGVLMTARSLPEDDAFKLLRNAAMHANLKLAEVSRSVIDAARWAEAVNRAGQLRMLSQHLVALVAQRLAHVDPPRARRQQAQSAQRVRDNLQHLATLTLQEPAAAALEAAQRAWTELDVALGARLSNAALSLCDERAEALLQAADALTSALEASGARQSLAIVNRCGSQRMRTQRLTKDALLANLLDEPDRAAGLQRTMTEFEQVLDEIEAAPLSSPEIRAALQDTREGWLTMLRALRAADVALLVHGSEALLDHLDRLTESCERSLQVLMS